MECGEQRVGGGRGDEGRVVGRGGGHEGRVRAGTGCTELPPLWGGAWIFSSGQWVAPGGSQAGVGET